MSLALKDRIVENPGRIRLTAVSGEENVYDVTREEGAVTQAGTELNASNLNSAFLPAYEEYSGTVTYDAGTIGTRATAVALGSSNKTGMMLAGIVLTSASNASAYSVQLYVSSGTIYAGIYRASAAAVSGASITVRVTWLPQVSS